MNGSLIRSVAGGHDNGEENINDKGEENINFAIERLFPHLQRQSSSLSNNREGPTTHFSADNDSGGVEWKGNVRLNLSSTVDEFALIGIHENDSFDQVTLFSYHHQNQHETVDEAETTHRQMVRCRQIARRVIRRSTISANVMRVQFLSSILAGFEETLYAGRPLELVCYFSMGSSQDSQARCLEMIVDYFINSNKQGGGVETDGKRQGSLTLVLPRICQHVYWLLNEVTISSELSSIEINGPLMQFHRISRRDKPTRDATDLWETAIASNTRLTHLVLDFPVENEFVRALFYGMRDKNEALRSLTVNLRSAFGAWHVFESLPFLSHLKELHVRFSSTTKTQRLFRKMVPEKVMVQAMRRNTSLVLCAYPFSIGTGARIQGLSQRNKLLGHISSSDSRALATNPALLGRLCSKLAYKSMDIKTSVMFAAFRQCHIHMQSKARGKRTVEPSKQLAIIKRRRLA